MSKRKNPFHSVQATQQPASPSPLGATQINLSHLKNGRVFDLSKYNNRPKLLTDISRALTGYVSENTNIKVSSGNHYRRTIGIFWQFLSEYESQPYKISNIKDINQEMIFDFRNWLVNSDHKLTTLRHLYQTLIALLSYIQKNPDKFDNAIDKSLELPSRLVKNSHYDSTAPEAYTSDEIVSISKACRAEVRKCVSRIQRANRLVNTGEDPRIKAGKLGSNAKSWKKEENILWYVANVFEYQYLRVIDIRKKFGSLFLNATCQTKTNTRLEISSLSCNNAFLSFYASKEDLLPFLILLQIKTGLNLDSILSLKRNCIVGQGVSSNTQRIRYQKGRGTYETMERAFNSKGLFSPIGIIKAIMYVTERLVSQVNSSDKEMLFIGAAPRQRIGVSALLGNSVKDTGQTTSYLINMINRIDEKKGNGLFSRWGLKDKDGNTLKYSSNKMRTTYLSQRYESTGSLAYVSNRSAKHHGKNSLSTTANNYLTGDHTEHLHNEAIRNAQLSALNQCINPKVIATSNNNNDNDVSLIQAEAGMSKKSASDVLSGKQDVFIAQCKDFYDSPFSKKGTPCSEPWGCFTCKNAIWTSSILPRLLSFMEFIKEQRHLLGENDWHNKFGLPWLIITRDILPKFSQDKIDHARAVMGETSTNEPARLFIGG